MTLEEQMICGALQTLNEEAMEDVLQSEPPAQPANAPPGEALRTIRETLPAAAAPPPPRAPSPHSASDSEGEGGGERRPEHVIVNLSDDVFL